MRKVTHLVLAMALVAGVVGAASADKKTPNSGQFPGQWYDTGVNVMWGSTYGWGNAPSKGTHWTKDFAGEVIYCDPVRMQIKADGSGDIMNFTWYQGITMFTPSQEGVRCGSKVKVRCDDARRLRAVEVVPFYKWLKGKTK